MSLVCFTAEITAPTLWIKQLVYKENKQNSSNSRKQGASDKLIFYPPHPKMLNFPSNT